jgi:hypothetical protein
MSPNPKPMKPLSKNQGRPAPLKPPPHVCAHVPSKIMAINKRDTFAFVGPTSLEDREANSTEKDHRNVVKMAAIMNAKESPV